MDKSGDIENQIEPLVLDVAQVIALEQAIAKAGTPLSELMDRAGRSVARVIIERRATSQNAIRAAKAPCEPPQNTIIFCGTGNNGGDGWVCAHELATQGWPVSLVTPCRAHDLKTEPARSAAIAVMDSLGAKNEKLSIIVIDQGDDFEDALSSAGIIVDSLLGTGFSGATLRSPYKEWVEKINAEKQKRKDVLVLAIDVPSGLSAQTGEHAIPCVKADLTITMIVYKPGLLTNAGKALCGETVVSNIAKIKPYINQL